MYPLIKVSHTLINNLLFEIQLTHIRNTCIQ